MASARTMLAAHADVANTERTCASVVARAGSRVVASEVAALFNASGAHVLQENNDAKAHRGAGGGVVCPMHFFRTGLDIRPTHGSVVKGMQSVRQYNEDGLTGPGCWAHADMLAVGVTEPQPPGANRLPRTRKKSHPESRLAP